MADAEPLHELEPVRGLPEELPEGETILWQGSPRWWALCRRAFHVDLVLAYFVALAIWRVLVPGDGEAPGLVAGVSLTLLFGALAAGTLMVLAALFCRTTIYTLTNRRVVMQFGVALPINLNLPFTRIDGAGHRVYRDGSGDIPLQLRGDDRLAYLLLWPHARPWHVRQPEPMLRCLEDSDTVASLLADALRQFHDVGPDAHESAALPPSACKS